MALNGGHFKKPELRQLPAVQCPLQTANNTDDPCYPRSKQELLNIFRHAPLLILMENIDG